MNISIVFSKLLKNFQNKLKIAEKKLFLSVSSQNAISF